MDTYITVLAIVVSVLVVMNGDEWMAKLVASNKDEES